MFCPSAEAFLFLPSLWRRTGLQQPANQCEICQRINPPTNQPTNRYFVLSGQKDQHSHFCLTHDATIEPKIICFCRERFENVYYDRHLICKDIYISKYMHIYIYIDRPNPSSRNCRSAHYKTSRPLPSRLRDMCAVQLSSLASQQACMQAGRQERHSAAQHPVHYYHSWDM